LNKINNDIDNKNNLNDINFQNNSKTRKKNIGKEFDKNIKTKASKRKSLKKYSRILRNLDEY